MDENMGERIFTAYTESGPAQRVEAQICGMNKPLLSMRKVVSAGNRVVLDEAEWYIEDKASTQRIFSCRASRWRQRM